MIVDGYEMTASHSERDIYNGCVSLMQEVFDLCVDYITDYLDVDMTEYPDEALNICFAPQEIVERLFLWHTSHSGGTSQALKCKELGVDTDSTIEFSVQLEGEG